MAQDSDVARVAAALKTPGIRYRSFGNDAVRPTEATAVGAAYPLLGAAMEQAADMPTSMAPPPAEPAPAPELPPLPPMEPPPSTAPSAPVVAMPEPPAPSLFAAIDAAQVQNAAAQQAAMAPPPASSGYSLLDSLSQSGETRPAPAPAGGTMANLMQATGAPPGPAFPLAAAAGLAPAQPAYGQPASHAQPAYAPPAYAQPAGQPGLPSGGLAAPAFSGNWVPPAPPPRPMGGLLPAAAVTVPLSEVLRLVAAGAAAPFDAYRAAPAAGH